VKSKTLKFVCFKLNETTSIMFEKMKNIWPEIYVIDEKKYKDIFKSDFFKDSIEKLLKASISSIIRKSSTLKSEIKPFVHTFKSGISESKIIKSNIMNCELKARDFGIAKSSYSRL
jgi:hypothetical protein